MPRLFLGLPLPLAVRESLATAVDELRTSFKHSKITWVNKANYHITLHFIGEVATNDVDAVIAELPKTILPKQFDLHTTELTAFPHPKAPKTIIVTTNIHPQLLTLRQRLANTLILARQPYDGKQFHPHITLGRVISAAETLPLERPAVAGLVIPCDQVILYESTLTPTGSIYRELSAIPLSR